MIKLLDCTLRDGGYVNNWDFGNNDMNIIANRLISANVDIVEVGFIDERVEFNVNRSIQPTAESFNIVLKNVNKNQTLLFGMIDYGTCAIEKICEKSKSVLDGIRIIFKKPNMLNAIEYALKIKNKGYLVCLQMVSITSYSENDVECFCKLANAIKPYAVAIVDTYGLLMEYDLLYYYNLLNKYLDIDIAVGYHSHNNFQLGYANSIKVVENQNPNRHLMIDGTLYGMGKSAGNAPLELLALYLNNTKNKNYNMNQILEAIDCNIMKIFYKKYWGYSYKFFLSSANNCHPSYTDYLIDKKTLSIDSINEILSKIVGDDKLNYSIEIIKNLYKEYQSNIINDTEALFKLRNELENKDILILGLGKSINEYENKIKEFINNKNFVIISLNAVIDKFKSNYIFISNSKRYENIVFQCNDLINNKIIATSNILELNKKIDYILNYDKLTKNHNDTAILILLEFLLTINSNKVYIAGCDGFLDNNDENYFDSDVELVSNNASIVNEEIAENIILFKQKINIEFLTPSLYEKLV